MRQQSSAPFVTIDPATGRVAPTAYASLRARLDVWHPVSPRVPEPVREELAAALAGFALAYEWANAGHGGMYNPLTDDAYVRAVRALELALRERLGRGRRWHLDRLIGQAVDRGLLPGDESATVLYQGFGPDRAQRINSGTAPTAVRAAARNTTATVPVYLRRVSTGLRSCLLHPAREPQRARAWACRPQAPRRRGLGPGDRSHH